MRRQPRTNAIFIPFPGNRWSIVVKLDTNVTKNIGEGAQMAWLCLEILLQKFGTRFTSVSLARSATAWSSEIPYAKMRIKMQDYEKTKPGFGRGAAVAAARPCGSFSPAYRPLCRHANFFINEPPSPAYSERTLPVSGTTGFSRAAIRDRVAVIQDFKKTEFGPG